MFLVLGYGTTVTQLSSPCLGPVLKSLTKEKTCFPKDNHYLSPSALTLDYEMFGPPSKW